MAKELKTYLDFAENNYEFLIAAYEQGLVGNARGAMAQETKIYFGICAGHQVEPAGT